MSPSVKQQKMPPSSTIAALLLAILVSLTSVSLFANAQSIPAPIWSNNVSSSTYVLAGYDRGIYSSPFFVCRATLPSLEKVVGKRTGITSTSCSIAVNNTVITLGASVSESLVSTSQYWWGASVPVGGQPVRGGTYNNQPSVVCRILNYPFSGYGPHSGWTTGLGSPAACTASVDGTSHRATTGWEYLFSLLLNDTALQRNATAGGATPVVPSPSATPSSSPTASASPSPAVPGKLMWLNATGPENAMAISNARPFQAGTEDASIIYVCVGYLANGDVVPGKYESVWRFCDIPLISTTVTSVTNTTTNITSTVTTITEVEANDATYEVLLRSPWLVWTASSNPPLPSTNAVRVTPGTFNGKNVTVCRAFHPIALSGPHSGWTDGTPMKIPGSGILRPACVFSYGGSVVHAANFDILYLYPATANLTTANLAATVFPKPSVSPTPSGTPTTSPSTTPAFPNTVTWMNEDAALAAGYQYTGYVRAGSEGGWGNNDIYVCRGVLPNGQAVAGKWESVWKACNIPLDGIEVNDVTFELLIRSPYLMWSSGGSEGTPVIAGTYNGLNSTVCRAWHPLTLTGPHAGFTNMSNINGAPVCVFSYGGGSIASYSFDLLLATKQGAAVTPTNLPQPSRSQTPTGTPTPSPSMAAPSPGQIQWLPGAVDAVKAGMDVSSPIYVCRGLLPATNEMLPGKWIPGWKFCDIAIRGIEYPDPNYELLRTNPRLAWIGHTELANVTKGAVAVSGGVYAGLQAYVCRAMHKASGTGPHAGYTDNELYNGSPLCFFSYGGKIERTSPFDYLYMLAAPSATPSPTKSPIPSATPSRTPSLSITSSSTNTASTPPTANSTSTATATATSTSTGSTTSTSTLTATTTPSATSSTTPSPTPTPSRSPPIPIAYASPDGSLNPGQAVLLILIGIVGVILGFVCCKGHVTVVSSTQYKKQKEEEEEEAKHKSDGGGSSTSTSDTSSSSSVHNPVVVTTIPSTSSGSSTTIPIKNR